MRQWVACLTVLLSGACSAGTGTIEGDVFAASDGTVKRYADVTVGLLPLSDSAPMASMRRICEKWMREVVTYETMADSALGMVARRVAYADMTTHLFNVDAYRSKAGVARVQLAGAEWGLVPQHETKTDVSGHFVLPDIPVGDYLLVAMLGGYTAPRNYMRVTVRPGKNTADLTASRSQAMCDVVEMGEHSSVWRR